MKGIVQVLIFLIWLPIDALGFRFLYRIGTLYFMLAHAGQEALVEYIKSTKSIKE